MSDATRFPFTSPRRRGRFALSMALSILPLVALAVFLMLVGAAEWAEHRMTAVVIGLIGVAVLVAAVLLFRLTLLWVSVSEEGVRCGRLRSTLVPWARIVDVRPVLTTEGRHAATELVLADGTGYRVGAASVSLGRGPSGPNRWTGLSRLTDPPETVTAVIREGLRRYGTRPRAASD